MSLARHAPAAADPDRLTRRAPLSQSTYDATARTVEAVLSAGSAVKRWGFIEKLEISPAAIDLGRVQRGLCQLLDTHNAYQLDAVLGRVTDAKIEGGKLIGTFAFGETDAARQAEGMVARGEIKGISVGYKVTRWDIAEGTEGEPETRTATAWELLEVSLVPVPADTDAGIRSLLGEAPAPSFSERNLPMNFTVRDGIDMIDQARTFGPGVERIARDLVDQIIDGKTSPDAARAALLRAAGDAQNAATAGTRAGASTIADGGRTFDNPRFRAEAIIDALHSRMTGKAPAEEAREYMRLSIPQIAAEICEQRGYRGVHRMSAHEAIGLAWRSGGDAQGMTTTFDLPHLLQESGNRFLLDKFAAYESPIKKVARRRSASDFRDIVGLELGGIDELRKVNESGEIEFGSFKERQERYRLHTYARRFTLSRQAIINDDLGVFTDALSILARTGAKTESKLLADLVNSNPNLADGVPMFDDAHGNLVVGSVPSIDALDAMRAKMREQRDIDDSPVFVSPKYVLAPIGNETDLEVLLASTISAATTATVNPFAGKLEGLIDPLLTGAAWYMFSDPAVAPALEYAHLDDNAAPHIEMNEAWETLGTGYRAYHDFGAAFIDHRGAVKNPGT